ncbi:MAG TPA: electron transfer flavoprotein subunit beta/FixA family protein [Conexivisphaerales archaeon]|nr:electron transfer flavoprotein subunit beta/FixA family protein [Conexivisphaerales archaeon]
MLNIVVLVKHVYDENQLKVDRESGKVNFEGVPGKISDFDRSALEAALVLRSAGGGKVTSLTLGPEEAVKSLREVMAMGADQTILIKDQSFYKMDAAATARVLHRALEKAGPVDLLICAEGSVDSYTSLLAPMLAEKLHLPLITYAQSLQVKDGTVRAERALEKRVEVVEAKLPAFVTVTGEINDPRIPTLLQIMAAMKKPVSTFTLADLGIDPRDLGAGGYRLIEYSAKSRERRRAMLEGTVPEAVSKLVDSLAREGLVS